ncbi:hypothetical protein BOO86_21740 [Mycobacterium sp. CBMA 234]|uniref:MlaD family protein n=1 Tax=Mycolicibacterium sp. CBMA 234 TaxID=1918495 RepID=UPI0012DCCE4B|nr:MlaD family protein [Mycolicibacterium sp. CBMA 234]MUL67111.1 hypothetical protein [Mycolicibacterium sp. CBMA 234]
MLISRAPKILSVILTVATATGCSAADRVHDLLSHNTSSHGYCAIMSDSIGLYPGNSVSRMGVPIGRVDHVETSTTSVRVTFSLDHGITVPGGATAVTRTPSILADRTLELAGGDPNGAALETGVCIPIERTATAKSITESTAAATNVLNEINDAGQGNTVNRLVGAASTQLAGNGATLHDAIANFTSLSVDPTHAAVDANQMVREISTAITGINDHWDDIGQVLVHMPPGFGTLSTGLIKGVAAILSPQLNDVIQVLLDVATHLHDIVWNTLDTTAKTIRLLSEHTGVLVMYAGTFPNIIDGVRSFWARLRAREIPMISPRVAAGPSDDGKVCSNTDMDPTRKDHCGFFYGVPDGGTSADLLQLVLNGGVQQP